jgi:poly(3-hydroxybutyrate) depolymerase
MSKPIVLVSALVIGCGSSSGPMEPPPLEEMYDGVPGEHVLRIEDRDVRVLVPSGYDVHTPIPLVIAFHGACNSGTKFWDHDGIVPFKQGAEPANYIMVVPDTKGGCEFPDGFCADFVRWQPTCGPDDDTVGSIVYEMEGIVWVIWEIAKHWRVDPTQVHALGHSDGGLFIGIGGMGFTDQFASFSIFAMGWGAGYPLVDPPARLIPTQFICGSDDTDFCPPAQESEAYFAAQGHPTRIAVIPGEGHGFADLVTTMTVPDLFGWMTQHPLE